MTAACWHDGLLRVRLSGSETGVKHAVAVLGGESSVELSFWTDWRDQRSEVFRATTLGDKNLVRVVTAPAAAQPERGLVAFDWAGGVRWMAVDTIAEVETYVAAVGGWYWPVGQHQCMDAATLKLMQEIRRAFDPEQMFFSPLWPADERLVGPDGDTAMDGAAHAN